MAVNSVSLSPDAVRVRQFLISRAAEAEPATPFTATITYGHLAEALDPTHQVWKPSRYRGLGQVLGDVSRHEHAQGRSLLSALVVWAGIGVAGDGFFEMARNLGCAMPGGERLFWQHQVHAVVKHWQDRDDDDPGSATDQIRAYLAQAQASLSEAIKLAQEIG